jgi:hypothetical protein
MGGDIERGGANKNNKESIKKGALSAAALVASGLAGAALEHARMQDQIDQVAQTQKVDKVYIYEAPKSAVDLVNSINTIFSGAENLLPQELIEKVSNAIDEYMTKPERERVEADKTADGTPSKSMGPLSDLWSAVQGRSDVNPIAQGVILSQINKRYDNLRAGGFVDTYDTYGPDVDTEPQQPNVAPNQQPQ